jgi:hypothetical protein
VFQEKMSNLASTLKGYVKGRQKEEHVSIGTLSTDSGLTEGFVYNAIESNLLGRAFNMRGAVWMDTPPHYIVRIPVNFGHEPLFNI